MHIVNDAVKIEFGADGSHQSGILSQRFVQVPNNRNFLMIALAGADIAGDILNTGV
jgi:hypothetical protein